MLASAHGVVDYIWCSMLLWLLLVVAVLVMWCVMLKLSLLEAL
jgi:hypothetical protein